MIKVVVIGAGGVIGQHMMISVPEGVDPLFTRRTGDGLLYIGLELCEDEDWIETLDEANPDVIVNLAGESNVDTVEKRPEDFYQVNVMGPARLRAWCDDHGKHLIHVSSQITLDPVNEYGKQKVLAEEMVRKGDKWTIVRPTFVLGIRPFPGIGRENPAERILAGKEEVSVDNRYFSVSFAWDVAEFLWDLVILNNPAKTELYVGNRETMSRLSVARGLGVYSKAVGHEALKIAQRPKDTTYTTAWSKTPLANGLTRLEHEFGQRSLDTVSCRAREIAGFLGKPWWVCLNKLEPGFGPLHNAVSEDLRKASPTNESELGTWYRTTESYIWELTAYHLDKGFNYAGMGKGIAAAFKSKGVKTVLCLGDGVGDLSLFMVQAGMTPWYNDLFCSTTAAFAEARFLMRLGDDWGTQILLRETSTFDPIMTPEEIKGVMQLEDHKVVAYDAVVSLDFLEHMPNVEEWVKAIYANLKPGGYFFTKDTFDEGSGTDGAIPMHLAVNDHFKTDWEPFLVSFGFEHIITNWYRKPE
jgi:dTDP-4-dehydrorhamnose reductase/SAM-dependent methyltransferase